MSLDHDYLRSIMSYDPSMGTLTWLVDRGSNKVKGTRAGSVRRSKRGVYRYVKIDDRSYNEARLIWFYVYGRWPKHEVDHINRNSLDNRLMNLREADDNLNMFNRDMPQRDLPRGIYRRKNGKFQANCQRNGKRIHCGTFVALEDAIQAHRNALIALWGDLANEVIK